MADNSWFEGDNSPGAGDLGEMGILHSHLADTAEAARTARTDLKDLQQRVTVAVWTGPAADEFKKDIDDKFLGQLAQLDASYQDAADGFATYITTVGDLKTRSDTLARQIYAAESTYDAAATALMSWSFSHSAYTAGGTGATSAPPYQQGFVLQIYFTIPATASDATAAQLSAAASAAAEARSSHDRAQAAVETAWNNLQALYRQMHDMQATERVNADTAVIGKLREAHDAGIRNESGWHHFFRALATVAKWVGIALAVVAIIAIIVLMGGVSLPAFFAALGALTDVSAAFATGGALAWASGAVVYGGAAASAAALAGNVGMNYSYGDEKAGWGEITLNVIGVIPGLGIAGRAVSRLGGPAARVVSAIDSAIATGKLGTAYGLESLLSKSVYTRAGMRFIDTTVKVEHAVLSFDKYLLELGENKAIDFLPEQLWWSYERYEKLREGQELLFPEPEGADGGVSADAPTAAESAARAQIAELQQSQPAAAARARTIAASLAAGSTSISTFPLQRSSGEFAPAH